MRLFRRSYRVVHAFQKKSQPNAGAQTQGQGKGKIAWNVRLYRFAGHARRIYVANVIGTQARADPSFFQLFQ